MNFLYALFLAFFLGFFALAPLVRASSPEFAPELLGSMRKTERACHALLATSPPAPAEITDSKPPQLPEDPTGSVAKRQDTAPLPSTLARFASESKIANLVRPLRLRSRAPPSAA